MSSTDLTEREIRSVLGQFGKLSADAETIGQADDLFRAGLTSHAAVNVMLGLEDAFGVEFPDEMLRRTSFESIEAITASLSALGAVSAS